MSEKTVGLMPCTRLGKGFEKPGPEQVCQQQR